MTQSHDDMPANPSGNRPFDAVLRIRLSRREVLSGGLAGAAAFLAPGALRAAAPASKGDLIGFTPVAVDDGGGPRPAISPDYEFQVLVPWGDPLQPGGPAFRWPPNAADQAEQLGIGHDGLAFFTIDGANDHGLLVLNHEFGRNRHVLGKRAPASLDEVRVSQHAHGVSVVAIRRIDGRWDSVASPFARRIHANTPVAFSGPAADHPLLQNPSADEPRGTLNNCACGTTPWGTYLTCEENFQGYFGATRPWKPSDVEARYGLRAKGFNYGWEAFDPRFELNHPDHANEANRFGWVVEIDPFDPDHVPVKRTALGRFKHEGIAITEGRDGRLVGYMADDQAFEYLYKFVTDDDWRTLRDRGQSPLDHGRLYVARFNDDGTGTWRELTLDNPALAARFGSQAEVLVHARIAADLLGATPMDRPEWTTVAPDGRVYCALTNNRARRVPDAANPLAPNPDGHVIRWRDADDHLGTTFTWDIFLVAQETHGTEATFSDPDGVWADPDGRLFILTDGGQQAGLNNQLLVADTATGEVRRLLTGVPGCEVTGIAMTPDRRTAFVNLQHPGNGDPNKSTFPSNVPGTVPRDATIALWRKDGGVVGS